MEVKAFIFIKRDDMTNWFKYLVLAIAVTAGLSFLPFPGETVFKVIVFSATLILSILFFTITIVDFVAEWFSNYRNSKVAWRSIMYSVAGTFIAIYHVGGILSEPAEQAIYWFMVCVPFNLMVLIRIEYQKIKNEHQIAETRVVGKIE